VTGPEVVPDVDLTVLEQLDFPIKCDMRVQTALGIFRGPMSRECEKKASYILACRWCAKSGPCCTEHGLQVQSSSAIVCTACGKHGAGIVMFTLEPLSRS